ncbi:hypothetical protein ACJIZ3_016543 [Penstemon smallii]|uniref:Uncharacterized protein n=1 Tax=Penstemon smallii TaxID=265156 RepID=A0ABD3STR0_9LAMI
MEDSGGPSFQGSPPFPPPCQVERRKRIARYKVYTVEGRVKASITNGIRWIKNKCSQIIHGY